MSSKTFIEGVKTPIKGLVTEADGLSYLPWATAVALAGRPEMVVEWPPHLSFFGGAVVCVRQGAQKTFLPVLDGQNRPIPSDRVTSRDLSDTINRCRAKSAAMVNGVGLSLYAGYGEDVVGFLRALGVKPDSDLSSVEPLTSTKGGKSGATYVDWASSLAAARITDPDFHWEVVFNDVPDPDTGEIRSLPFFPAPIGFLVAVSVTYKGMHHTEFLPIMGVTEVQTRNGLKKMDHQPLTQPNVFDWNRSVMRCLAKAIAVVSGYGLSVYAKEDVERLQVQPLKKGAEPSRQAAASEVNIDRQAMIDAIEDGLRAASKTTDALLRWLGKSGGSLRDLSDEELLRSHQALFGRKAA